MTTSIDIDAFLASITDVPEEHPQAPAYELARLRAQPTDTLALFVSCPQCKGPIQIVTDSTPTIAEINTIIECPKGHGRWQLAVTLRAMPGAPKIATVASKTHTGAAT